MRKDHHDFILDSAVKSMPFFVSILTPVLHYCMGGLEIKVESVVISSSGKAMPGYSDFA